MAALSRRARNAAPSAAAPAADRDGCTLAPDLDFRHCCDAHDDAYATRAVPRYLADHELRWCIARRGYRLLPWVYWLGVLVAGWLFW